MAGEEIMRMCPRHRDRNEGFFLADWLEQTEE